jgi:hypothetical protein
MDASMVAMASSLTLIAFCSGIYFWGRGIVMASRSDQIAGPVIFVAMGVVCAFLWGAGGSIISGMMATVLALATILFVVMARRTSVGRRIVLLVVGFVAALLGVLGCLPAL